MLKDIFFLIALCFFACVDSWAGCFSVNIQSDGNSVSDAGQSCGSNYGKLCNECQMCAGSCGSRIYWTGYQYLYLTDGSLSSVTSSSCQGAGFSGSCGTPLCLFHQACDTEVEADSVACVTQSKYWVNGECKESLCDSTHWECQTFTETTQTTIATENVTCFNGECYGGIYCEFVTRNETTCTNECGTSQTEIAEFPMRYDGACNEETAPDEDMCSSQKCMTNNGFYHLYRLCQNRNIVNGEAQIIPVFSGGGLGTCANAGYKEENPNVNGGSSSSADSTSVPQECYTMGKNCPVPSDSTDYSEQSNRTLENGCTCEPYDGTKSISLILCPDGSGSIFYGSCSDWNQPPLSSSNPPESSGSGSENPPTSSGGDGRPTDWVNYSQGEQMKALLGQIVLNTAKENQITINNQSNLSDYAYNGDGEDLELNRTDSVLVLELDTNGIMAFRDSLFNRIFDKIDTNNSIIDTLPNVAYSGCPAVRLMGGGSSVQTTSGVYIKGFTIDFCDVHGFNLVRIISVIVTSFASVVGFFVGFKIFKSAMG